MKGGAGVEMSCKVSCRCAATVGAEHDFIYCVWMLSLFEKVSFLLYVLKL